MMFFTDLGRPISWGWNIKAKNLHSRVIWCNFYHNAAAVPTALGVSFSPLFLPSFLKPEKNAKTKSWDQEGKELFKIN